MSLPSNTNNLAIPVACYLTVTNYAAAAGVTEVLEIPYHRRPKSFELALLTSNAFKSHPAKATDIDRAEDIFTDYRHAGDFIRRITETLNL